MAGPIKGSIEHYIAASLTTGSAQMMFVNCYNFLNNNTGTLGIQRIAYNTGSQDTGMTQFRGMNYYDQANPAGQNAWACFRFLSASVPYDVLIQWTGATSFGTAPGSPAQALNTSATNCFAVAVAQSTSSVDPWNGSRLNNGNDTKGTPVWISSSNVVYYPRSNDTTRAGTHGSSKQNMAAATSLGSLELRCHFVADYDNFVILWDASNDTTYGFFAMLKYTPMSGVVADVPYFSIQDSAIPATAGTIYGNLGGTIGGGTSWPSVTTSGSISVTVERLGTNLFVNTTCQPNRMYSTQKFDEFPIFMGGFESPNQVGMLGQHSEFMREVYNIATHNTNETGTRAVFGGSTTQATIHYTIPWHSGTTPGTGIAKTGVQFGLNGG